ncbi:Lpg1974 family pore-forming outer membrane protein [Criblamydia sequanensis]|uniref:Secreted protein n=1 Tax=Candidatus Criblamydia sequanensis CRIB-18 TaxID=1437425 RepID=A0A090CZ85_9BACT|nr:Lpg1974 family pore-forming outer membrane protein [Criblamydia sequanensis]CDR34247.1 putative secreted protein [Criblamydia sequanensis CRIB-18]
MISLKKINFLLALVVTNSVGCAFGDYYNYSDCQDNNNCYSCEPCQPACCGRGYIGIELLYWRAFNSGFDVCIPGDVSTVVTPQGTVITDTSGRWIEPDYKWKPGFRIGAFYEFGDCPVFVGSLWSHLRSHSDGSRNENSIRWDVDYDVLDLIVGYDYDLNSCVGLRPYAGLRYARIDQKIQLDGFSLETALVEDFFLIDVNNRQDFTGIGPLIGIEGDVGIGCGFSVYANLSVACLYGNFKVHFHEFEQTIDTISFCNARRNQDASIAVADAGVGIRWETCYCNTQLILQLGLEHHRYYDYNRLCHGDLSFDGVNFSIGIEY